MPALNFTYPLAYHEYQNSFYTDSRFPGTYVSRKVDKQTLILGGVEQKVGTSNPNWRQNIAKKIDATSAYIRRTGKCSVPLISCSAVLKTPTYEMRGFSSARILGYAPTSFPSKDNTVQDIALTRLKRKIQKQSGSMNLLLPIGELKDLKQTVSGSAKLTESLLHALIDLKRTKGKSGYSYASEAWLTYGFGIQPLLSDTATICKSIADYLLRTDHTVRLTGTFKRDWFTKISESEYSTTGLPNATIYGTSTMLHMLRYRWIGGFNFTVRSANNYGAMEHFNVGLGPMIPTAWELLPYSWVADYFGTIGDFLEDVFIATPGEKKYLMSCRKYTCDGFNTLRHVASNGNVLLTHHPSSPKWSYVEFERLPYTALPHRIIRFKTSDETGRYGVNKLLNLASILLKTAPTKEDRGTFKRVYSPGSGISHWDVRNGKVVFKRYTGGTTKWTFVKS